MLKNLGQYWANGYPPKIVAGKIFTIAIFRLRNGSSESTDDNLENTVLYRNTAPAVVNLGEDATVHHGIDRASCEKTLTTVSFNLHGFYQGCPVLEDLIASEQPDILMLQEHWLTPAKLCLWDSRFINYFLFGCSAMTSRVEAGILHGRPYGGVMTLIKKDLHKYYNSV